MIDHRPTPPRAEACLRTPYPSSQKGRTVIAEHVTELAEHERMLRTGSYRPEQCPHCGGVMHIHEYRERVLLADPAEVIEIAIFRCARREQCGAVIRVLPAFVARHLWRSWPTVAVAMAEQRDDEAMESASATEIPARTRRRWQSRLASSAAMLVAVFATAVGAAPWLRPVIASVGHDGTRRELLEAYAVAEAKETFTRGRSAVESVAGYIHRLARGVRLM